MKRGRRRVVTGGKNETRRRYEKKRKGRGRNWKMRREGRIGRKV